MPRSNLNNKGKPRESSRKRNNSRKGNNWEERRYSDYEDEDY